ncbi:MAG: hypothetical protein CSB33_00945 [Desulfobacterales bacterium]|nr:MAG: hypothetical protein CSB33_00945 [Desulfobacterales bacterium]
MANFYQALKCGRNGFYFDPQDGSLRPAKDAVFCQGIHFPMRMAGFSVFKNIFGFIVKIILLKIFLFFLKN